MPSRLLKPIFVMFSGALIGFYSIQFFKTEPINQNRFLASATMSKLGSEQFAKTLFDIKIKNENISFTDDDVSTVKVTIEAFQKIPVGVTYIWQLPENAIVVEGATSGALPELSENQTVSFEIKLKGYSRQVNSHVVFAVKGDINQTQIDRNVIVSSRPEDSFEYIVQENEKARAIESQAKNKMGKSNYKSPIDPKNVVF